MEERFAANIRRLAPQRLPAVLDDFLEWLTRFVESNGWGAQPFDRFQGGDYDAADDHARYFTFVIRMGNGDEIGVWHGAGAEIEKSPVVLVGHEGEYEFVGQSALHFLARLAIDPTLRPVLLDLEDEEGGGWEPFRSALASWLEDGRLSEGQTLAGLAALDPRNDHPDFRAWYEAKFL